MEEQEDEIKKLNEVASVVLTGLFKADLATERARQLTTARANQTTGLTNGRVANWAPEVVLRPFRALSRCQLTFDPVLLLNQP